MTILALEFSSPQRSVAVLHQDGVTEVVEAGDRATNAFRLIEQALSQAALEREAIEAIAVGLGPGSYTGIRVALSLAQGWQLARNVKLLGVSSVDCLAAQAQADKIFGRVQVIIDAQRNEFYRATYEITTVGWKVVEPLIILPRAKMECQTGTDQVLIGPEVRHWFPQGRTVFPRAAILGKLARDRNDFVAGDKLEPIYLRETNFVKAPIPHSFPRQSGSESFSKKD